MAWRLPDSVCQCAHFTKRVVTVDFKGPQRQTSTRGKFMSLRPGFALFILLLALLSPSFALDGIAVSAKWQGKNENLYGGWGKIYRYKIQGSTVVEGAVIFDGQARFATINQEGTHVAFIQSDGQISMVPVDGGAVVDLVKVGSAKGYLDWPDGQWLYYSEGGYDESGSKYLKKVNVTTRRTASVTTFNTTMWLWSIARDGDRASVRPCDGQDGSGTGHVYRYVLSQPTTISQNNADDLGMGCGNAIAPSGSYIMRFDSYAHSSIAFHNWDRSQAKRWTISDMNGWGADMGSGWNRNRWSCNADNWICTMQGWDGRNAKDGSNQVLYDWRNQEQVAVTNDPSGSRIQNEAGDLWVGSVATNKVGLPSISPSGGTYEGIVSVTITCPTVGASIYYTTDGSTPTTSSRAYTSAIDVDLSANASVTLKTRAFAAGMTESDIASAVFTRAEPRLLTSVTITPSTATVAPAGTLQFNARAYDQDDAEISPPPSITWSVSHSQSISGTGLFSAGNNEGGPYTVTATAHMDGNTASSTATVLVKELTVAQNLLGYWSFDDVNGMSVPDQSGNGNDGTVSGATPTTAGKINGALSFDGSQDLVALGELDVTAGGSGDDGLTLAAWVKASSFSDLRILSKATGTSEQDHYWMLSTIVSSGNRLRFRLKTGSTTTTLIASSGTLNTDTWHHAAATYDGSTMKLWLDGGEVGSAAKTGTVAANASVGAAIGANPDGQRSWNGLIDEACVFDRALTAQELTALMSGGLNAGGTSGLTVTAPNGSEIFRIGEELLVKWSGSNSIKAVIDLSVDAGESWITLNEGDAIDSDDPQWGAYVWTIPSTVNHTAYGEIPLVSNQCWVKIWDYNNPEVNDMSNAPFEIADANATNGAVQPLMGRQAASCAVTRHGIRVWFPGNASGWGRRVALYDLSGHIVRSASMMSSSILIDRSSIAEGTYLIEAADGRAVSVWKISIAD